MEKLKYRIRRWLDVPRMQLAEHLAEKILYLERELLLLKKPLKKPAKKRKP
jgi:hypothetical protein